jgi:hypothetical protein
MRHDANVQCRTLLPDICYNVAPENIHAQSLHLCGSPIMSPLYHTQIVRDVTCDACRYLLGEIYHKVKTHFEERQRDT